MPYWIQKAIKHPGSLKKSLGVSKDDTIPKGTLDKAAHSKSSKMRKRAILAKTLSSFHGR